MTMAKRRLNWIGTTGGPHLVVPEKHAIHWEGVAVPSHGRVVQAKFRYDPTEPATDYDRACDVEGYLGVVRIGRGRGLVLADVPLLTAYHLCQGRHFLLQWDFAPSESALLKFFESKLNNLSVLEEASFRHPGGRLVLCDASDTPRDWLGDYAMFELTAGQYLVTASRAEAGETGFVAFEWKALT
jgi:hypothetical protein